jgi:hypothetical protein
MSIERAAEDLARLRSMQSGVARGQNDTYPTSPFNEYKYLAGGEWRSAEEIRNRVYEIYLQRRAQRAYEVQGEPHGGYRHV